MASTVIVGGGTGGMAAARALRAGLPAKHEVTLIEQKPDVCFQPSFLWLMVGRRQLHDISRRTFGISTEGVDVICSKALSVNTRQKTLCLEDGRDIPYEQLILAPGADATQADTRYLAEVGYNPFTSQGALALYDAIECFSGGELIILATSMPYKCQPAIYEVAFLLNEWFRKKGTRKEVRISIYTPEMSPLHQAGAKVGQAFREKLKARGINLYTGRSFQDVEPSQQVIHFDSGPVTYDLLVYVPRHRPPGVVSMSGLTDESGWVPVDPFTLETGYEGVFAIGDVNRVTLPSGHDLPKAGMFAHMQALVVAENIQLKISGKKPSRFFGGKSMCVIETGAAAFPFFGDIFREKPWFITLPESRLWLAGKEIVEREWLMEHS